MYDHTPVLLNESLQGLNVDADGVYVDCTFGRGGHSRAILERLGKTGYLLAFDKDPEVVNKESSLLLEDPRMHFFRGSFTQLEEVVESLQLTRKVNGILLDLGVSSPQIDNAERGFSFLHDGLLDMRMDNSQGMNAAEWLLHARQEEIADVLYKFGDERFSRRIARAIVRRRNIEPIVRTSQLANLVAAVIPGKRRLRHPATKTFQAIRIFINRELEELEAVLLQALRVLKKNGRLLVMSFHSLEDRLVKKFMRTQAKGEEVPRDIPVMQAFVPQMMLVGKPIFSSQEEIENNPRARSAVLRIAEYIAT